MCPGIHLRVCRKHDAIRPDEIGDALGEWDQSTSSPDRLCQLVVAVAEQAERKSVLFGELPVLFGAVVGNTKHFNAEFLEFVPAVPQPVGFERSTGGAGLWIEEEQERATLEIGTRYRGAVLGLEFEINEWFSDGDHLSSSSVPDCYEHRHQ